LKGKKAGKKGNEEGKKGGLQLSLRFVGKRSSLKFCPGGGGGGKKLDVGGGKKERRDSV